MSRHKAKYLTGSMHGNIPIRHLASCPGTHTAWNSSFQYINCHCQAVVRLNQIVDLYYLVPTA